MNAQQSIEQSVNFHTDMPVGEILRRTRVHYNLTIEDVANYMRIRAAQLNAIETGETEKLPGRVYAIGYIRTYSEYLGLDGEKMVQIFKQQSGGRTNRPDLHFPVAASESKAPNLYVIAGSLGALVVVVGIWIALSSGGKKEEQKIAEIPNIPADMRVTEVAAIAPALGTPSTATTSVTGMTIEPVTIDSPAIPATAATIAAVEPAAVPAKKEIVINVKERSWVEVRDKAGKPILSRILKPGEVFIVPEENYGLRLDTGNAGGLELLVNGQAIPPLGKQGDILRGMVLDGNKLLPRVSAKRD